MCVCVCVCVCRIWGVGENKCAFLKFTVAILGSFSRDGIHISAEGSKIVVKEIMKVLREANWEPSLHWKSLPIEFEQVSVREAEFREILDEKTILKLAEVNFQRQMKWE